ncbi:hypothetical protein BD324DRAFT_654187 [Kockovaella imperatae]|uniref:Uncharacterized protein n=1 Tax=Kockovaella imperatae TaxID=4999 RepID=A0A1Y1U772_9TREE|nr:hypothetical protein BD324DRAFT_654187 [Kockovaella imperatae]ORX33394.1 hypothetical protein BD324DRAFT_654187 [Kockovaella imperatae]
MLLSLSLIGLLTLVAAYPQPGLPDAALGTGRNNVIIPKIHRRVFSEPRRLDSESTHQAGLERQPQPEPNTLMPASKAIPYLNALDPETGSKYFSFDLANSDPDGNEVTTGSGDQETSDQATTAAPSTVPSSTQIPGPHTTNFQAGSLPSAIIPPYYSADGPGGPLDKADIATMPDSGAAARGAIPVVGATIVFTVVSLVAGTMGAL